MIEKIKDIIFWWQTRHIRKAKKRYEKANNNLTKGVLRYIVKANYAIIDKSSNQ
jgi:hypothetical protein